MKILAKAAKLAAEANEADNPVAINARNINEQLVRQGWATAATDKASKTRIFASESGKYGTGLDDAALATDTWDSKAEGDKKLAQLYLNRMQYAYGPDEADWGKSATELSNGKPGNLYATLKRHRRRDSLRTSNLYGMLTTDDPFQYLGGIALAVRHLDGRAPELYISICANPVAAKLKALRSFWQKNWQRVTSIRDISKGLWQKDMQAPCRYLIA
jgi:cobaltochelatase CobN